MNGSNLDRENAIRREQYSRKVQNIMTQKNELFGLAHQKNFDKYYKVYGEMTPINSDIINNMPNAEIILDEEVYGFLLGIMDVTNKTNQEWPFLLYGKEISNNKIEFTNCFISSDKRQSTSATFDQNMVNSLQNEINKNSNNGLVVCHGHSHPPIGAFHQNFSLGDFISYMQMNQENSVFKNRKVELIGCLVTSTGDINFVFYDNKFENFYRFTNVFVKEWNGSLTPVNCYGLNQSQKKKNKI